MTTSPFVPARASCDARAAPVARSDLLRSIAAGLAFGVLAMAQSPQDDTMRRKQEALDRALEGLESAPADHPDGPRVEPPLAAAGPFKLFDLSFDTLFAAGTSTETDDSLQSLQGGGHDPRKRGFTVQNVEVGIRGAVDPYLRAEAYLIWTVDPITGESATELEEAFLTTTSLPYGLEIEAGHFFTEFGRHNPGHPHAWDFLDAPVIATRVFGPDGMRGPGARVGWLAPLPWFAELHLGVQNANGETMASFLANEEYFDERAVAGRPFVPTDVSSLADMVYLLRLVQSWQLGDATTVALGGSALFGPNATGGDTRIYGLDLVVDWNDGQGGREAQEVVWTTEFVHRDYDAGAFDADDGQGGVIGVPATTLRDQGVYTQAVWKLAPEWSIGLRYECATGDGDGWDASTAAFVSRESDPFRDDRQRVAPLVQWQATHYSRARLQYNYDRADHLETGDAHSIWLGVEVGLGPHAAHKF